MGVHYPLGGRYTAILDYSVLLGIIIVSHNKNKIKSFLKNKKEPYTSSFLFFCKLSLFYVENLLAVVVAANLAYAVRLKHLTACGVGALYKSGHCELGVVGSSLISACCGHFLLRYCHIEPPSRSTLLYAVEYINYFFFFLARFILCLSFQAMLPRLQGADLFPS